MLCTHIVMFCTRYCVLCTRHGVLYSMLCTVRKTLYKHNIMCSVKYCTNIMFCTKCCICTRHGVLYKYCVQNANLCTNIMYSKQSILQM